MGKETIEHIMGEETVEHAMGEEAVEHAMGECPRIHDSANQLPELHLIATNPLKPLEL